MSAHTPGPWRVSINENPLCKSLVAIVEHSPERFLAVFADVRSDYAVKPSEYVPNAHMLSAASEQHSALRAAPDPTAYSTDNYGQRMLRRDYREWFEGRRAAAIAKAEGK